MEIDDIVHNSYTWDIMIALSWKDSMVKVNIYVAFRFVNHTYNCNLISTTEQMLDVRIELETCIK